MEKWAKMHAPNAFYGSCYLVSQCLMISRKEECFWRNA